MIRVFGFSLAYLVFAIALTTGVFGQTSDRLLDTYASSTGAYITTGARQFAKTIPKSKHEKWAKWRRPLYAYAGGSSSSSWSWNTFAIVSKLPTVVLSVQPVPPKNYQVWINGEKCPLTDTAKYLVPPGTIQVKVTYPGKTPCNWSGTLSGSDEQEVDCAF
jgi:hypothetical protein